MHSAIVGVKTESESKLLSVISSGVFYHVTVKKGNGIYIAPLFSTSHSRRSGMDQTVSPANYTVLDFTS